MTLNDFFDQMSTLGVTTNAEAARLFLVSSQTIKNWRVKAIAVPSTAVPGWVPHATHFVLWCAEHDLQTEKEARARMSCFPDMTVDWFKDWQSAHAIRTYQQTADLFGLSRQAIHNWFCRGKFPLWIPLACLGIDVSSAEVVPVKS